MKYFSFLLILALANLWFGNIFASNFLTNEDVNFSLSFDLEENKTSSLPKPLFIEESRDQLLPLEKKRKSINKNSSPNKREKTRKEVSCSNNTSLSEIILNDENENNDNIYEDVCKFSEPQHLKNSDIHLSLEFSTIINAQNGYQALSDLSLPKNTRKSIQFYSDRRWLWEERVMVLDTETTGLKNTDRITEITIFEIKEGKLKKVYSNNKIQNDDFPFVFKEIRKYLENSIVLAHNASFDIRMIGQEIERMFKKGILDQNEAIKIQWKDTAGMMRRDIKREETDQSIESPEKKQMFFNTTYFKELNDTRQQQKNKKELKEFIRDLYEAVRYNEDEVLNRINDNETKTIAKSLIRSFKRKEMKEIYEKEGENGVLEWIDSNPQYSQMGENFLNKSQNLDDQKKARPKVNLDSSLQKFGIDPNKIESLDKAAQSLNCQDWTHFCQKYDLNPNQYQRHYAAPDVLYLTLLIQLMSEESRLFRHDYKISTKRKYSFEPS